MAIQGADAVDEAEHNTTISGIASWQRALRRVMTTHASNLHAKRRGRLPLTRAGYRGGLVVTCVGVACLGDIAPGWAYLGGWGVGPVGGGGGGAQRYLGARRGVSSATTALIG